MAALFGPYAVGDFPEGWPDGPVAAVNRWPWRLARAALGAPAPVPAFPLGALRRGAYSIIKINYRRWSRRL